MVQEAEGNDRQDPATANVDVRDKGEIMMRFITVG